MRISGVSLTNGGVTFGVADADALPELAASLERFLAPYFWRAAAGAKPQFTVRLRPFAEVPAHWRTCATRAITIRSSPFQLFRLGGRSAELGDGSVVVVDETTATAYHVRPDTPEATFYGSPRSFIHLVEFVRSAALLVEDALGTLVLHAAASIGGGGCWLIVGHKGAGKTTTALHLVLDHGHRYLSGDKVLVSRHEGRLVVRGWPDYPCVGAGTLGRFAAFAARCGARTDPSGTDGGEAGAARKQLLDPDRFRGALACAERADSDRVAMIVLPAYSPAPTRWTRLTREERQAGWLAQYIESPYRYEAVQWHPLLATHRRREPADHGAILETLAARPWLRVTGLGQVPATALASGGSRRPGRLALAPE